MQAVIKIEALGHVLVLDELTRENDIDRDAEKWSVEFDGQCVAKMYLHPDHGWPKIVTPLGRDKVQEVRTWIWSIARAHKVNAENILEVKGPRGGRRVLAGSVLTGGSCLQTRSCRRRV